MYCGNCGTKLSDNSKFCNECGEKVGVIKITVEKSDTTEKLQLSGFGNKKRLAVVEIILSAVFLFALTFLPNFAYVYKEIETGSTIADSFGLFKLFAEDEIGVLCVIAWLHIIAALFFYIKCSQMEKYFCSFLCTAFIVIVCVAVGFSVAEYKSLEYGYIKSITLRGCAVVAIFVLLFIFLSSVATLIAIAYDKLKFAVYRKINEKNKDKV